MCIATYAQKILKIKPGLGTTELAAQVSNISFGAALAEIINLLFPDITVEAGATMICAGPITNLNAGKLVIDGTIEVYGTSLNLNCLQLGGSQ